MGLDDIKKDEGYSEGGSATLDRLLKERLEARENKDYVKADTIRAVIS